MVHLRCGTRVLFNKNVITFVLCLLSIIDMFMIDESDHIFVEK